MLFILILYYFHVSIFAVGTLGTLLLINYQYADSFHHQVELALKKQKKTYDVNDFEHAVKSSNSGKVDVNVMDHTSFYNWKCFTSVQKLQKKKIVFY